MSVRGVEGDGRHAASHLSHSLAASLSNLLDAVGVVSNVSECRDDHGVTSWDSRRVDLSRSILSTGSHATDTTILLCAVCRRL